MKDLRQASSFEEVERWMEHNRKYTWCAVHFAQRAGMGMIDKAWMDEHVVPQCRECLAMRVAGVLIDG